MQILTINLGANATQQFQRAGGYFEILSSTGPVNITFYAQGAGQSDSITGGQSGLYLHTEFGAFDVQDASGAAQQISVLVCDVGEDGGSRRQPGNVRVVDEFFDSIQCANYASDLTIKGFTTTAILLPANNLKGAIVRWVQASATSGAGGISACTWNAAKSPMTNFALPLQHYPLAQAYSSGGVAANADLRMNKLIPPGWGIYVSEQIQTSAAAVCNGAIGFDLVV